MRVAITSRIFQPEPSAASYRLSALGVALGNAGHDVTVLTVRPGRVGVPNGEAEQEMPYQVRRFPVLRDRTGYVRGYVQYMSFDVPLFFRLLLGPRRDLIIVEPPPTTGFFVRLAATLRRVPYVYYAADIWSDAAESTGAPKVVSRVVRVLERFSVRGAALVLSVSDGVTQRLEELDMRARVATVGNGIDAKTLGLQVFSEEEAPNSPMFVYAGTASEWHGADVFVRALPRVLDVHPEAVVWFIGGGAERQRLEALAAELGVSDSVRFDPVRPLAELGPILRGATAAIASLRPGAGYDIAFPTKLYSAAVCGAPLVFSGPGPAAAFVRHEVDGQPLGQVARYDHESVAAAMIESADTPYDVERRSRVAAWATTQVSLAAVAERANAAIEEAGLVR